MSERLTPKSAYEKGRRDAERGKTINYQNYFSREIQAAWLRGYQEQKYGKPSEPAKEARSSLE